MRIVARFMALLLALIAVPAWAETVATVMSPAKRLTVTLELDNDGRPSYTVSRGGKLVIAPSRLGFILADAPKLDRNFKLASQSNRSIDENWDQPWGEW
jgi:alpha-glucosidase